MNALDLVLDELASVIADLDPSGRVDFFRECAQTLRPLYDEWLLNTGAVDHSAVLDRANRALNTASITQGDGELAAALVQLNDHFPLGDAVSGYSSTGAQACWFAYDCAVRSLVDPSFPVQNSIEYILQPVLEAASERLFGVSQVGSGPDEDQQLARLVSDPQVQRAVQWVRSAVAAASARDLPLPSPQPNPLLPHGRS